MATPNTIHVMDFSRDSIDNNTIEDFVMFIETTGPYDSVAMLVEMQYQTTVGLTTHGRLIPKKEPKYLSLKGRRRLQLIEYCEFQKSIQKVSDMTREFNNNMDESADTDADDVCQICLNDLEKGHMMYKLPCSCVKLSHSRCLDEWFKKECACPTCRFNVNTNMAAL